MSIRIDSIKSKRRTAPKPQESKSSIFGFLNRDISLFGSSINDKCRERFYSDIAVLLSSGIDIKTSLELIAGDQKKASRKQVFLEISQAVIAGSSLSEALEKSGKFSAYEYYSMKIGEEGGCLTEVLNELAVYYTKKIKQKRQLTSALSYPVIVLMTALAAVVFMLNVMVPMFKDVFKRFGGELPEMTKLVIRVSEAFSDYIGFIAVGLLLIIVILITQKKKRWFRRVSSGLLMRMPIFGLITRKIYLSRFCQSMALLIASRTPMLNAIQLVRNMIGFYPFEAVLEKVSSDIVHGKALYVSMGQFGLFDSRMISLIKVAEEVNQLDSIFNRLYQLYSEEVEHRTGMISNLLEPFLIVFVGLLVSMILVSMYLPMFQLSTTIY